MILINLKIYKEAWGEKAIEIGKMAKEIGDKYKIRIVVAAPALEALRIKEKSGAEVWLQNVDEYESGQGSGWVSMAEAMSLGIGGSMLNHSEHKIAKGKVSKILKMRPKGFEIIYCTGSIAKIREWRNKTKPDWILYEPPELIGSKDKSVASEKAETIAMAAKACKTVPLLVGAGVKSGEDVSVSLERGAVGVGLASGLVLADDPRKVLLDLVKGFGK